MSAVSAAGAQVCEIGYQEREGLINFGEGKTVEFRTVFEISEEKKPILYVPIGASGSGKSTLYTKVYSRFPHISSCSFDAFRLQWYGTSDYKKAWEMANKDLGFYQKAQDIFSAQIKAKESIYLDATNLNPSKRRFYLETAKKEGYCIIALVFSVGFEELVKRQSNENRGEGKSLSGAVVQQHLDSTINPQPDENFTKTIFLHQDFLNQLFLKPSV